MSVVTLAVLATIYRPLLLSSFSAELTRARGINLRGVGLAFMMTMAVSVGLSAIAVGSILSTALLIGPAAAAVRLTTSVRGAMSLAGLIGVLAVGLGILFAYDSFYWLPSSQGLPVSFFIVGLIFVTYLVSGLSVVRRGVGRVSAGLRARTPARVKVESLMFSGFMVNAWQAGTIVAVVAGVVGFFVVLRGSAFPAARHSQRGVRGRGRGQPDRAQSAPGARRLLPGRRARHRLVEPSGSTGRRHRVRPGHDARARRGLREPEFRSTNREIFSLLFGEILGVSSSQIVPEVVARPGLSRGGRRRFIGACS